MKSTISKDGHQFIITPGNRFSLQELKDFREIFDRGKSQGCREIIVDLNETEYIDSSAVGTLINIGNSLEPSKNIRLLNPQPQVKKVLNFMKVDKIFKID